MLTPTPTSPCQVITWGHPDYGGTGPAASGLPSVSPVRRLWVTSAAFAALRDDGRVITWGSAAAGGDSRGVEEPLGDGRRLGEFGEDGQGVAFCLFGLYYILIIYKLMVVYMDISSKAVYF